VMSRISSTGVQSPRVPGSQSNAWIMVRASRRSAASRSASSRSEIPGP
jgi:hypothetical protein